LIKSLLLSFCLVFITESFAQKRVALVIGNSDYQEQSLRNPSNDARDISKVLRSLGFEVDLRLNVSQEEMESSVQEFGKELQGNTVGLFYYSGHGVQYEGSNYLIPIGAMSRVSAPDHLRYKAVDAGYVLGVMKQARNGLNIVILDACRDNPFKSFSRSMNKGLKRISGAEGTIIAYSTSPGKVALDGSERNSPYTAQIIKQMVKPNLPVEIMFKHVRKGVKSETGGKQSPWYEASIDGDFYFNYKSTFGIDVAAKNNHASSGTNSETAYVDFTGSALNVSKKQLSGSENGRFIIGVYGLNSSKYQNMRNYFIENGYVIDRGSNYVSRTSWMPYKSTVFYYHKNSKEKAREIAIKLSQITDNKFNISRGAGTGLTKGKEEVTFFIHHIPQ